MAGKICAALAPKAISAATATGYLTVASTVGLYAKGICFVKNAGQIDLQCTISEVVSATVVGVRIDPISYQSAFDSRPPTLNAAPNYGRSDVSAYNGGTLTWPEQFIFNPNDLPLS